MTTAQDKFDREGNIAFPPDFYCSPFNLSVGAKMAHGEVKTLPRVQQSVEEQAVQACDGLKGVSNASNKTVIEQPSSTPNNDVQQQRGGKGRS